MDIQVKISVPKARKMFEVDLPEQKNPDDILTALFEVKHLEDRDIKGNNIEYKLIKDGEYLDNYKSLYLQGIINGDLLTVIEDVPYKNTSTIIGNKLSSNIGNIGRIGCFLTGVSVIGAGLVDAYNNGFHNATSFELFSTGITLITISLTGSNVNKTGKGQGNE